MIMAYTTPTLGQTTHWGDVASIPHGVNVLIKLAYSPYCAKNPCDRNEPNRRSGRLQCVEPNFRTVRRDHAGECAVSTHATAYALLAIPVF
jgi:hypothetical protein